MKGYKKGYTARESEYLGVVRECHITLLEDGGRCRDRTYDPFLVREVL